MLRSWEGNRRSEVHRRLSGLYHKGSNAEERKMGTLFTVHMGPFTFEPPKPHKRVELWAGGGPLNFIYQVPRVIMSPF